MIKYLIIFICFFSFAVQSKDSVLTIKQQLDKLEREVNDLSKIIYSGIGENTNTKNENLIAFDLRIYDLEKDIKKINEYMEELIFKLDDLSLLYLNKIDDLEARIIFLDKRIESLELE